MFVEHPHGCGVRQCAARAADAVFVERRTPNAERRTPNTERGAAKGRAATVDFAS
jgi:hypothetical protein